MMSLADAQRFMPASRLHGDGALRFERVHTDTRSLQRGDLFVALRGERHDGHDHFAAARDSGAVAAIAERGLSIAGLPGLEVADSRLALGTLAAGWRRRFSLPLIAVTGSNGKTTVTQMIAAILRAWQGEGAFATQGNFNNDIGVPLTLLRLRQEPAGVYHRAGVVELGMNHPGEIAVLAAMAAPTVALVNNAQREHQEFMASVEAVARENGSVIEALAADGVAVFPAGDEHTPTWRSIAGRRRVLTFGLDTLGDEPAARAPAHAATSALAAAASAATDAADVGVSARWCSDALEPHWLLTLRTPMGAASVNLHVAGLHNVRNAAAATACALAAGCPIDAAVCGLQSFRAVKGRSQAHTLVRSGERITLIDDSYNANPDSVRAAIDVLADLPAPRWLVLGDMGEVGSDGPAFHREVGAYAKERRLDALWTTGALCADVAAAFDGARHFDSVELLIDALPSARPARSVLVKGSRFMRMERVVAALLADADEPSAGAAHAA
jgi:UDP-N-acetylmuramoyl-tripeptide--D-alanyl-D-alanine ligase